MKQRDREAIQAVLLDLDGVLYVGDKIIRGGASAVRHIRELALPVAGVTNTTTQPRSIIAAKLAGFGIPITETEIFTPAALALKAIGARSARLYVREPLLEDFNSVRISDSNPDYVVMGDIGGEGYPPDTLLEIFRLVMNGAKILALHKNRFWQKPDGLHLDIGPFVAAVEYATGKEAAILGKPSRDFFHGVCEAVNVRPEQALMVGDDIESDIAGARDSGLRTALVQTGKYRSEFVKRSGIRADLVIPSIADLPDALKLL
ncbi:HAD-superfamily subfamily IIA hydrolase, TIGR01458 [Mariprofundus ferrinatatus]|uniref:Haloacid dehalogenase-like hydrolase domain-containing protein 2 n=1 Tax=Mariprofundus ferrinatatus TaxID=1921087 RepID=A0A2K8L494_9PROT|nr:TIGR01458 family HAD-type hydrolase [Mariprofundus ferrinatatus]ATX82063.1 HAD-superfamily subfamily IIA hydrolase, TIGR01458 [Mariprofundus ferrinatatus]